MKNPIIKSATKYSYDDFIEIAIYADLTSTLKQSDKILTSREGEYEDVIERLKESNIPYASKSKREIVIVPKE